ncbi:ACP phosphodiesterase [Erwinia pyrifoliae]|uniref:ACP phosphodiesterase n=1 Tax=Erwinia pyrifoliae TaxID=79967 RepID=A0ABY5X5C0_ERWPY|nr:ACP phosphodiesterase [Erwinia pyrifoliae]UWS32561.1 ACP phosphodiesterase [Erwinia pyrifoliae]
MNYLAHLHLAHLANSSLLGNLMADYVRGNPWQQWPTRIADAAFLSHVLNGMASRRPKLAALADSYQDFTDNYHRLEDLFWQSYPQMTEQAVRGKL